MLRTAAVKAAATNGAMAITANRITRMADCRNANVRPRVWSSTSSADDRVAGHVGDAGAGAEQEDQDRDHREVRDQRDQGQRDRRERDGQAEQAAPAEAPQDPQADEHAERQADEDGREHHAPARAGRRAACP